MSPPLYRIWPEISPVIAHLSVYNTISFQVTASTIRILIKGGWQIWVRLNESGSKSEAEFGSGLKIKSIRIRPKKIDSDPTWKETGFQSDLEKIDPDSTSNKWIRIRPENTNIVRFNHSHSNTLKQCLFTSFLSYMTKVLL